jgi:hypothetical protein
MRDQVVLKGPLYLVRRASLKDLAWLQQFLLLLLSAYLPSLFRFLAVNGDSA